MRARARFMGLALAVLAGLAAVSVDAAAVKQVVRSIRTALYFPFLLLFFVSFLCRFWTRAFGLCSQSAGAYHLAVLYDDGTVSAWGSNEKGQLNVPSNLNNVVEIATGYEFTVALKRDGSLVAWGSNEWDQLKIPSSLPKIKQIAANGAHTLALSESGRVYAFGGNGYGSFPSYACDDHPSNQIPLTHPVCFQAN